MANILYLDDDELAITVMNSIIQRSSHKLTHVTAIEEFNELLRHGLEYDVLFVETKLGSGKATPAIKQMRDNPFLSKMPLVVYSKHKDKDAVKDVMVFDPQNYLFKPYKEKTIREEIKKATRVDWRIKLAGDPDLFYTRADDDLENWLNASEDLLGKMSQLHEGLSEAVSVDAVTEQAESIQELSEFANLNAYPLYAKFLKELLGCAEDGAWKKVQPRLEYLKTSELLQAYRVRLLKSFAEEGGGEDDEMLDEPLPVPDGVVALSAKYEFEEIESKLLEIKDYPVVESAAGMFAMMANEDSDDMHLDEIIETIINDPGLGTAVLRFSNTPDVGSATTVEDIHRAVALVGASKVKRLAASFDAVPDMCEMFTAFRWQDLWAHQVGCAMLCEFLCEKLNLPTSPNMAYLAGLTHDIGKLLLCSIDPEGYGKVVSAARSSGRRLATCEKEYFNCNYCDAGVIFLKENLMPEILQNVVQYHRNPKHATQNTDMVALVCLARYLCMLCHLGDNGDTVKKKYRSITSHPAWRYLNNWLSPTFLAVDFIEEVKEKVDSLKEDLSGAERK